MIQLRFIQYNVISQFQIGKKGILEWKKQKLRALNIPFPKASKLSDSIQNNTLPINIIYDSQNLKQAVFQFIWNHRIVEVGRNLWSSFNPTPLLKSRVTYSKLLRTVSSWFWTRMDLSGHNLSGQPSYSNA